MKTKSLFRYLIKVIPVIMIISITTYSGYAQLGYSSASLSMGKMQSSAYTQKYVYVTYPDNCYRQVYVPVPQLPDPSEVVVEEYINYHKHLLEAPEKGMAVGIDLRWDRISQSSDEIVLQAGFSTLDMKDLSKIPPVNVCLVIDHSGSMQGDRLNKAKIAAEEFISKLRPEDILSIVIFDDQVDVIYSAQQLGNGRDALNRVRCIQSGGSTDLNSGLITGYKEVLKNFSSKFNNKVIMLTDALTNTGEVDPESIIRNSFNTSENMIDITIIGVGVDFNNSLSRKITNSAHTSIFFINDNEDIKKLFTDEIQSLMGQTAKDVVLEVSYSDGMSLDKVYGYAPNYSKSGYKMHLNNMNNGLTQVVLMKFRPCKADNESDLFVYVQLSYFDIAKKERVTMYKKINIPGKDLGKNCYNPLSDNDIKKNFTIAEMSQALYDMATDARCANYSKSCYTIDQALNVAKSRYYCISDPDIRRVYHILEGYAGSLGSFRLADCCE